MNINDLIESVVRTYSLSGLKSEVVTDDVKVKGGANGLESYIVKQKLKIDDLAKISSTLFSTSHYYCYVFESDKKIDFDKLKKSTNVIPDAWIAHLTKVEDLYFDGFMDVDLSMQTYDLVVKKYVGDKFSKKVYIPFRVKKIDDYHIGIMFCKFESTEFIEPNNYARVLENPHDPYGLAMYAVTYWMQKKLLPSTILCDLTKGIKKLVKDKTINSMNVTVEIDGGAHETRKEGKKKTNYKFVPADWHQTYLARADKIFRAKWYWYDGATIKQVRGLASLSVEPSRGMISQDAFVSASQEGLISDLLAANT